VKRALLTSSALCLILFSGVGCGGNTQPAQPPTATILPPVNGAKPEAPPLTIEYVVLKRRWVEKFVPAPAPEVKTWSELPENAGTLPGSFRHILFKVAADAKDADKAAIKKKAQSSLDKIKKGTDDFAKLAKQLSDDPGSKERGGEYGPDQVEKFVEPVRNAFNALKPGDLAPDVVESKFGFHIIRKDKPTDDQIEKAYRKAKAPEVTKKLADDLLGRLKDKAPSRPAIADATQAVLGDRAVNDVDRPSSFVIDKEHLNRAHLPAAAKAALETFANGAKPGELMNQPAVDGDVVVVARTLAPGQARE
jgi:hypothetical protein